MSIAHISDLRKNLERSRWVIHEERLVDEYDFSAYWDISRPDGTTCLTIAFDGGYNADGVSKRSFEQSCGCELVGYPYVNCYFGRFGRSWPKERRKFLEKLNRIG